MKVTRRFTKPGQDVLRSVEQESRSTRISNPDGSVVFEMRDAQIPRQWSQLAADIMVSKYFRKAGVPQRGGDGQVQRDERGAVVTGSERSAAEVVHRLAACWRHWGESHGYFASADDAQVFYDELAYMMLHQMCAPNSPQWFNTGLNFSYGITGPSQGHYYCDHITGEVREAEDAYSRPQPHACFIQSVSDDLVNPGGIMDLWTREARLFKYGSGTGSNFSRLRGENEPLSGGGKSSGLMSFLKIGDRAAGAIKSGGTTRRAAKMVCLDLDHPDIAEFVNWKVREEMKVQCLVEGFGRMPLQQKELAKKLGLKLDFDFNGESYLTVSGQNSNNSVRVPNRFFKAVEDNGEWRLHWRTNGKVCKTLAARDLWEQIAFAAWRCADPGVQFDDTINQWHTCPRSGRINASNPCVTGDTRVLTPGGVWRRIDQMIHLPARVVTNVQGMKIGQTEGAFPTGVKPVIELCTTGGYSVKLTPDHKVWTRDRGWVAAGELTTSDQVRLPGAPASLNGQTGEPRDASFFQLLGLFVSHSNNDIGALHLEACLPEKEAAERLAEYIMGQWADKIYNDDYVNQFMVDSSDSLEEAQKSGLLTVTLTNRRLISRLRAFVCRQDGHYRLSDEAFTAGLPAQKHLLRALFSADGRIVDGALELRSNSSALLEDVQTLLLGFGIRSARGREAASEDAAAHYLRVSPGSLASFAELIGLICRTQQLELRRLADAADGASHAPTDGGWYEPVASLTPLGRRPVFDLTEPATSSFIANGLTVHNCSEYMFLDDTACNLASLNLMCFFDPETRRFDIEGFKHAVRLWTIVLEISVLMASFPSKEIAERSWKYRTLGLGYANLGAMLMQAGIPYDSEKGRAVCAAITAILTGESYAASAEMSARLGAFPGYAENREEMLRVIRNHRRAAYDVSYNASARQSLGDYEGLEIKPVGIDLSQFDGNDGLVSRDLLVSAQECWDRAQALGEQHGYRNAQTTVIAPTGTIGLLMDCDTTGVEPDFALVKFKKLAGGGYFKIANQSLKPALVNLGYSSSEIAAILRYVMGTLTLQDAPHINTSWLKQAGFTAEEIERIEQALPTSFELSHAFNAWVLGPDAMERLGIDKAESDKPGFNLLRRLGFSKEQIDKANDHICGRGTIEGAPMLKPEHLPVFDCANRCGKYGKRFIAVEGHIRMMAAAQPFISGAISKTINLPNEATVEDIKKAYWLSWQLGLKANALYRDGSKLSQPLNVKSDDEADKVEEDDEANVAAAREEVAGEAARAAKLASEALTAKSPALTGSDNLVPAHTNIIEKIVERIVERPLRRRLPDTRNAITHKFDVAGHEGYITVGLYDDGQPGEVFITVAKEGSTVGGLMDTIATLVSVSLQYGVPIESLVRKFEHVRFEPSGMTRNSDIPMAKSLVDYIFRWMAMEFIPGYRATYAPKRAAKPAAPAAPAAPAPAEGAAVEGLPIARPQMKKGGNGHGPRMEADSTRPLEYSTAPTTGRIETSGAAAMRPVDPVSRQNAEAQADAPACDVCGSITIRNGACYKCLHCGNSMGCS